MEITQSHKRTTSNIARAALFEYFSPILYLFKVTNKNTLSSISKYNTKSKNKSIRSRYKLKTLALRVTTKAMCLNQGNYLQYAFLTAEKHRNLKDHFRTAPNDSKKLAELKESLSNYVNKSFYESTYKNFELLHAYFDSRNSSKPRICLKGFFKTGNHDDIVTVFRDSIANYDSNTAKEENSGFQDIYTKGIYFLENNIPEAISNKNYINSRINTNKAKQYYSSGETSKSKWQECWNLSEGAPESSHYKSTLIVPMTLWNNKLSEEFKELINLESVDRTIFGFLCIDHVDINYFNNKEDISIGYLFADLLSMYLFTRIVYMESSKTYSNVEEKLTADNITITTSKLLEFLKSMPEDMNIGSLLNTKIKSTENNSFHAMDSSLLNFVQNK